MKKIFLSLCLFAAVLASCEKDSSASPKQLSLAKSTLTVTSPLSNTLPLTEEVAVKGLVSSATVSVENAAKEWCEATLSAVESDKTATLTLTLQPYSGDADRKAAINVKSGNEQSTLYLTQTGKGKLVKMIVVNEGQFGKGTADISSITYDGTFVWDAFNKANDRPMGDVAQSLEYINGNYFVVMNGSNKVEVVEPQTFKSVATITTTRSPRFIAPINATQAVVSELSTKVLDVVNTKTFELEGTVAIPATVEKMTVVGDKLFGASGSKLYVWDLNTLTSGGAARIVSGTTGSLMKTAKMIADNNNNLWVMTTSSGNVVLNCVDPTTEAVTEQVTVKKVLSSDTQNYIVGAITGFGYYNRMDTDRNKSKLYFVANTMIEMTWDNKAVNRTDVYSMDLTTKEIAMEFPMPGIGMMYGMGIDPDGQSAYLCDCLDYTAQRGFLRQFSGSDASGMTFRTGVYPRMVHFTEYDK